jgi:formylglycine-generating enzyme required for sulfatase activity
MWEERKMKKAFLIFTLVIVLSFVAQAGTRANITKHTNLTLTIDHGTRDGVAAGQHGIVTALFKEPGGEYTINIGNFTVRAVFEHSAEVTITIGKGFNPADASYVVFDQNLAPNEAKTGTGAVSEDKKDVDWHLEQGDLDAEAGKLSSALEHYQKALALEPGNLIAQEKCNEFNKRIAVEMKNSKFSECLKNADANYEKNNIKFAFLFLIEALRVNPERGSELKSRMNMMAREYPREITAILNEKSEELKDIRQQIDSLLEKKIEAKTPSPRTKKKKAEYAEPFLDKISAKAERITRNEKGFWEAVFLGDSAMIYIPAGEFTIGSPPKEGDADEHPAHKVFIPGFWIGKTEVTFEQYDRFCVESHREKAEDEGWGRGKRPVLDVSWNDAREYCSWLEKKTGLKFRLPSEAEWEKVARDRFPWGNIPPTPEQANFNKNSMKTSAVGSFPKGASSYGALDMAGNVWEWVSDWYAPDYYANSKKENPGGPDDGLERVVRGGSWVNNTNLIRSANRSSEKPGSKLNILGFRLASDDN